MKRLTLSLFYLMLFSVSFGQFVEMTSIVPTEPKNVVDTLKVFGTGTSNTSTINHLNLGFFPSSAASNVNRPFQIPALTANTLSISNQISAGRDISIITNNTQTANMVSLQGGILFVPSVTTIGAIDTNNNPYAVLRANQITINTENGAGPLSLNRLEGKDIQVSNFSITQPVSKGNLISVRNQLFSYYKTKEQRYTHIYHPWSSPEPSSNINSYSSVSPLCSGNQTTLTSTYQAPCTEDDCYCNGNSGSCYEFRKLKLPAIYEASGASYEKIATVKFYCKYDTANSTCSRYMIRSTGDGTITEGFITQSTSNPYPNTPTNTYLVDSSASTPAMKCNKVCGNGGCTAATAQSRIVAINRSNGNPENFTDTFNNSSFCSGAATGYPAGSGLNCKANEKVFDIYSLNCKVGSGKMFQKGGEFFQRRKVICQQFNTVSEEVNVSSDKDLVSRGMFISVDY